MRESGSVSKTESETQGKASGKVPVAIVMISLNEAHNMEAVLQNLANWAQEVFLVDSYSNDETVDIALSHGVHVVQRRFRGFGDQWNFALAELPITARWTMKLDPDERLTDELKSAIGEAVNSTGIDGIRIDRRLWFMGRPLPIRQPILRVWRTGVCQFTDVLVNEHANVKGRIAAVRGELEHHDSPNLHHWYHKQNGYSTLEAVSRYEDQKLAATPKLFGASFERRMWVKKHFDYLPLRFTAIFLYYYVWVGLWRAGWIGFVWSQLRSDVYRMRYYKTQEMRISESKLSLVRNAGLGSPDLRVPQFD